MTTLKELWESKRLSPTQVAAAAGISIATLYKLNHKQRVSNRVTVSICEALGITKEQLEGLQADERQ